jgi:hypothetical protein
MKASFIIFKIEHLMLMMLMFKTERMEINFAHSFSQELFIWLVQLRKLQKVYVNYAWQIAASLRKASIK